MADVTYPIARLRAWRMPRAVYDRMIEKGILGEDDPIELLEGRLVVAEPKYSPHETSVRLVAEALRAVFSNGWLLSVGAPLALGGFSEPEPDVTVVRGRIRDYRHAHPTTAVLVVEVAESSLRLDRGIKKRIYATAGIADYWVVDLGAGALHVYRDPHEVARGRHDYRDAVILGVDQHVSPLAAPGSRIAVADLLP
jgi:Uma2 family endonuclease